MFDVVFVFVFVFCLILITSLTVGLLVRVAAPFSSTISASQSKRARAASHHCTFPPLSIQGAARGRVAGSTNERAAQVGINQ